MNHVGSVYGVMDEVFKFTASFKEFPPRSFPPSFNPATILEETLDDIKDAQRGPGKRTSRRVTRRGTGPDRGEFQHRSDCGEDAAEHPWQLTVTRGVHLSDARPISARRDH